MPERAPLVTIRAARPDELAAAIESIRDGYTAGMVDHAVARELYRSLGYDEVAVSMGKTL